MCPATNVFTSGISSNKFYPPQIDPARHLVRTRLLDDLLSAEPPPKLILIEAQAGQGKSTLAAQYLSRLDCHSAWYQIGPEVNALEIPRFLDKPFPGQTKKVRTHIWSES